MQCMGESERNIPDCIMIFEFQGSNIYYICNICYRKTKISDYIFLHISNFRVYNFIIYAQSAENNNNQLHQYD